MCFYTHAAAYSLYPRATFEHRLAVYCDTREARYFPNFPYPERYTMCGRTIVPDELHLLDLSRKQSMKEKMLKLDVTSGQRRVGDASTWVIPFSDTHEVLQGTSMDVDQPIPSPSPCTTGVPFPECDPVTLNSFAANFSRATGHFTMHFAAVCDERLVPQSITHKEETCFVVSQALSPKLQVWRQESSRVHPRALAEPASLLACWTELCLSKCTCCRKSSFFSG